MVKRISLDEMINDIEKYAKELRKGKIFIYPTDTVYGIGGNPYKKDVVEKIYKIKRRDKSKPLSVIAPSEEWIVEHFDISKVVLKIYFPGPYTLLLKKKDPDFLSNASTSSYVGVRIPDHPITLLVNKAEVPLITTSANLSGEKPPSSVDEIDEYLISEVDYLIIGKCTLGKPSTVINPYTGDKLR